MFDYWVHGHIADILYRNMPYLLKFQMVDDGGNLVYTTNSKICMCLSHILDLLLHPGIVILLFLQHKRSGRTVHDIISIMNILATFMMSRFWSIIHTYTNGKKISGWYFGYDVYHIHSLDVWFPAYIAEASYYTLLLGYWLIHNNREKDINPEKIH